MADRTKFKYKTFGRMVQDWGGWNDAAAVKGATTATLMCMSLGPPWIKQHSQSKMIEMAIIQQEWEEEFRNSWDTLTTRYLETDQAISTSGFQILPAPET